MFRSCFVCVTLVEHGLYVVVLRMDRWRPNESGCLLLSQLHGTEWSNCHTSMSCLICQDHKITKDKTRTIPTALKPTSISAVSLHQGLVCRNTCLAMHHQKSNEVHWQQTHLFCAVSVLWMFLLGGVHRMIWGASSLRQRVRGYGNPGWHWGKWQWRVSVKRQTCTQSCWIESTGSQITKIWIAYHITTHFGNQY